MDFILLLKLNELYCLVMEAIMAIDYEELDCTGRFLGQSKIRVSFNSYVEHTWKSENH